MAPSQWAGVWDWERPLQVGWVLEAGVSLRGSKKLPLSWTQWSMGTYVDSAHKVLSGDSQKHQGIFEGW